ncbi:hypothetical protein ACJX0J_030544, partial [Zea mays]
YISYYAQVARTSLLYAGWNVFDLNAIIFLKEKIANRGAFLFLSTNVVGSVWHEMTTCEGQRHTKVIVGILYPLPGGPKNNNLDCSIIPVYFPLETESAHQKVGRLTANIFGSIINGCTTMYHQQLSYCITHPHFQVNNFSLGQMTSIAKVEWKKHNLPHLPSDHPYFIVLDISILTYNIQIRAKGYMYYPCKEIPIHICFITNYKISRTVSREYFLENHYCFSGTILTSRIFWHGNLLVDLLHYKLFLSHIVLIQFYD